MNKCSAPLRDLSAREFQFLKLRVAKSTGTGTGCRVSCWLTEPTPSAARGPHL